MLKELRFELKRLSSPEKAKNSSRFFKTGVGEYSEGDIFLGITVPENRKLSIKYKDLDLKEIQELLRSKFHEERLIALLILVNKYESNPKRREEIFHFYLDNTKYINNWDLVDSSAHYIVGSFLMDKDKSTIYKLVKSPNIWERRISIISTFFFIRNNKFEDTLKISELLLMDDHDLIQKAVGWMLREMGKRDVKVLEIFLKKHYKNMPRTMLRYSIEKFPEKIRKDYLKGKV